MQRKTMSDRKRILFTVNTMSKAGTEVALLQLLKALGDGYDIDLYVMTAQGELISQVPDYVRVLNRSIEESSVLSEYGQKRLRNFVISSGISHGSGFTNLPYVARNLFGMLRSGEVKFDKLCWRVISDGAPANHIYYDMAVAFLEGASTYYVADHVKARHKVAFVHVDIEKAGYGPSLDRGCYDCFEQIFTVSGEVRDAFLKLYPQYSHKVDIINNLIDQQGIRDSSKGAGFEDGFTGRRILTVGRLHPQKGLDIAIDAMRLIKKDYPDTRWYVLGEGAIRAELERQIEAAGLTEDFVLMGAVDNPYPYMAQCDVYAMPSRFEGKSIALQEALTLGCCVVASDVSGNREQISNGEDGILCELSPEGVSSAIGRVLGDDDYRSALANAASKIVYDNDAQVDKLLSVMDEKERYNVG
ncbi:MAG: glycosyltransferase [Eubacterium sp.]|nr:glycosyltransferase [Eubacterium sp.]